MRNPNNAFSLVAIPLVAVCLLTFCVLFAFPSLAATESLTPVPALLDTLRHVRIALGLLHTGRPSELSQSGTLQAGGIHGTIECLYLADRAKCTSILGAQHEWLVRIGAYYYRRDVSGLTRRLNGTLLAHHRTMSAIETEQFLDHPEWLSFVGSRPHDALHLVWLRIQVPGGDSESMGFDRKSFLLRESIAVGEEGPEILNYSDWRFVKGCRFAFHVREYFSGWPPLEIQFAQIVTGAHSVRIPITMPRSERVTTFGRVRVHLLHRDDHYYVPIRLAGRTYECILDSGSQTLVLDRRVATEIHLRTEGTFAMNATQRMNNVAFGEVSALQIGAAQFGPQMAVVTDLGTTADGTQKIDGILGFPIFAQAAIILQPQSDTLIIAQPGTLPMHGDALQVSLDRGVIEVEAKVLHGSPHTHFVIDTGSAENLLLYHAYAQRFPAAYRLGTQRERTYGIGGSVVSREARLAGLQLEGMPAITNMPMHVMFAREGVFDNDLIAGSLGMAFLRQYEMNFDVQNGIFALQSL